MDKYPYFTEKNLHKHYKAFDFCSFFILVQQTSLHNGEGETVSYSSSFPYFLQEDWQTKCKLFYLALLKVIPVKVVKVVMVKVVKLEIWWEKKVLKIVYINNIYYLYILSLGEKNTFKNRVWPLWQWPLWPHLYYFQKLQCRATDIIRKIQGLRIPHILSNLRHYLLPFLTCFA